MVLLGRGVYRDDGGSGTAIDVNIAQVGPTVVLTWTADPLAAGYKVARGPTRDGQTTLLSVVAADVLTYTDTSPLVGNDYYEVTPTR